MSGQRTIVFSALSAVDGGPYTVCYDCIEYAAQNLGSHYRIVVLVNSMKRFNIPGIERIEIPSVKNSWLHRLYYEYIYSPRLSKKLKPHLWFSLLDVSPKVTADIQAVYCHNSSPFYPVNLRYALWQPKFLLFQTLYSMVYRKNIERNDYVVTQQEWLRKEFQKRYPVNQVVVARPSFDPPKLSLATEEKTRFRFVYPVLARVGKNFEVICKAVELLKDIDDRFEVVLFTNGKDSRYAQSIFKRFSHLQTLQFIGRQEREKVLKICQSSDAMIFSSKLESWGMPIMEFKQLNKPILVSRLPYAFETIGDYKKAKFFDPDSPKELASYIRSAISGELQFDSTQKCTPEEPYAESWEQLFEILLSKVDKQRVHA